MATLDDSTLDSLRELNNLRDHAKELRARGRDALAKIPKGFKDDRYEKLATDFDLSNDQWVSGGHPIDVALLVRVLNHRDLGDYEFDPPLKLSDTLAQIITTLFTDGADDKVPILTAARAMHALVGRPQTVFSTATMLCYYRIVRELYLATFPNWIIGAARAGEGGRVSAFVTGECVRAILAFQTAIRNTITFFKTTKKLYEELERLRAIPNVDEHLKLKLNDNASHWSDCLKFEFERVALDWYATNDLRHNVIALDLSQNPSKAANESTTQTGSQNVSTFASKETDKADGKNARELSERSSPPGLFPLVGTERIDGRTAIEKALNDLPDLLSTAIQRAQTNIANARDRIEAFRAGEAGLLQESDIRDLTLLAEKLSGKDSEYEYYRLALTDQTRERLAAYRVRGVADRGTGEASMETIDEKPLTKALVRELNETFKKRLVAGGNDWEELTKRVAAKPKPELFREFSKEAERLVERHLAVIKLMMKNESLPEEGSSELIQLNRLLLEEAFKKAENGKTIYAFNRIDGRRFDSTLSAHDLGLRVIHEALDEADNALEAIKEFEENKNLLALLDRFTDQHLRIYKRIQRTIEPAKRYIQDVLNRELAQAANSAKFDAGELLFAAASFGAVTKWKQNEQLAEARRLLTKLFPEDGRLQTSRPLQSTSQGSRLMPIAFEMTRCFAQLQQKDFTEDLDPKVVRKILNAFDEHSIQLAPGENKEIGWNFRGAPESQKPSVWVTAIAVFALDRTVRMLNERINAMVLRHFNVEWPSMEVEPLVGEGATSGGKLHLNELIYPDYELHSSFTASEKNKKKYEEDPARVDRVSVAIRLQQMRAHLTRAVLPDFYSKENKGSEYEKAYSAILYGPHGTGKTTLAEALAATAKVPLVRLSPSDLMVQGTDVIESRARAIFDSLSMLTQVVIFLDEFEPVVRTRETDKKLKGSPQDPPEFRFLVTGMLPKLIKLNKSAEKQSVVYCLATNYLTQLDKAAKRIGRFDLQIPIYHPDPMSRIGVFLYRLITILQKEKEGKWNETLEELTANPSFWSRTHEAIVKTREVSAQSLATIFFSPEAKKSFLTYVRDESPGALPPVPTPEKSSEKGKTTVEEDIEAQRLSYEESWRERLLPGASNALPPS